MSFIKRFKPDDEGLVKVGPVRIFRILLSREYKLGQKGRLLLLCLSQKFNVLSVFVNKKGELKWRRIGISLIRLGLSYSTSTPSIFRKFLAYVLYLLMYGPRGGFSSSKTTAFVLNRSTNIVHDISVLDRMNAIDVKSYVSEPAQNALQRVTLGLIWSPIATDVVFQPVLVESDKIDEIFYGGVEAAKESILSNKEHNRKLDSKKKKEFYMSKARSEALGERVLMEWSLKLVYAENLESGKIGPTST